MQERSSQCSMESVVAEVLPGNFLEWEIGLRLFYIQIINDMKAERQGPGQGLVSWCQTMDWRLEQAREELNRVNGLKCELDNRIKMVKQDQECQRSLIKANDETTLESLSKLHEKLKRTEFKLEDLAREAGVETPTNSFKRTFDLSTLSELERPPMFLPDLSLPPPILPQCDNLFSISGQLAEFCRSEHGSKFVAERLRSATQLERSLVMTELELPQSFMELLANPHCRKVIHALMMTDNKVRHELEVQARRQVDTIRNLKQGTEILAEMFNFS